MSRNIPHLRPTTDPVQLKVGTPATSLFSVGSVGVDPSLHSPTSPGIVGEGPIQHKTRSKSWTQPFFRGGLTAVAAIGLALIVGFGSVGTAHAQEATTTSSCARDAAYSASIGAELGRALTGDANGGRIGGALAALIHRANCTDTTTNGAPAVSAELQRFNAELDQALRQDSTKFTGNAEVSDGLKQVLGYLADQVRRQPNLKIVILAHANEEGNVPFVNRGLATERANAVAAILADKGIPGARLEVSGTSDGDGQNRVQIVVLEPRATTNTQPSTRSNEGGFLGIPGLTIHLGGDRGDRRGTVVVPNGTVNGSTNGTANGTPHNRTSPGPGNSGWNGR